ncbi:MAG: complex I NDUFA9 subunit family protein [Zoogloeaceae bacterium]|jgi:NADH dehydrogenase|nr:complex I NDUFA9 subunit family protein [Zoogloeaceae bacterium]
MSQQKILLPGGSGFLGSYLATRLAQQGYVVTIPSRRRERHRRLMTLPNVSVVEADAHDPAQLAALVAGQDAVINLVGILHSRDVALPYSKDFLRAHVELPQKIVDAMRTTGVRRLLHVSALQADERGASEYLRSKGAGERIVLAAQDELDVTVFRPAVMFGAGDHFLAMFARWLALPLLPLGMLGARLQPVWVADVADAIAASLNDATTFGRAYDLAGSEVYTFAELLAYVARLTERRTRILPLSEGLAYLQAGLWWLLPKPEVTQDSLRTLQANAILDADSCLPATWRPALLEAIAPTYLSRHTPRARLDIYRARARRALAGS